MLLKPSHSKFITFCLDALEMGYRKKSFFIYIKKSLPFLSTKIKFKDNYQFALKITVFLILEKLSIFKKLHLY